VGNFLTPSYANSAFTFILKAKQQGIKIKLIYSTSAIFASEQDMHWQQTRLSEESSSRITDFIASAKKEFKQEAGVALKLNEVLDRDSLELVNASMNNPRRVFVYRRFAEFEILNGAKQ
nr:hypothetical protein [Paracoccaceae bacterium]